MALAVDFTAAQAAISLFKSKSEKLITKSQQAAERRHFR
jgi:hypothetical protein